MDAATCTPNINARGRKLRTRMAWIATAVAATLLAFFTVRGAGLGLRLIDVLPAMVAAAGFLQVRRNTCVAHAATGMREGNAGLEKADPNDAAASRRVALTIHRDIVLVGVAMALVDVASTWVH